MVFLFLSLSAFAQVNSVAQKALDDGISKYKKKDYTKAIEFFTKAIEIDSNFVNAYIYRALSKDAMDNFPAAISDFNKARKIDTNDVYVYVERAQTFLNMGEMEAAMKDFQKIVDINPTSLDAADAFYYMARICYKTGKYELAVNYYTRVTRFRPKDSEIFFLRGEAKFMLGDSNGAIKDFTQAIELDDDNELAFTRRAEAKLKLGDQTGACEDFKKGKSKGDPKAQELLKTHCQK